MSAFYRPDSVRGPRGSRVSRRRRSMRSAVVVIVLLLGMGGSVAAAVLTLRLHPRFTVTRVVLEGVPDARRSEAEELTDGWIGKPLLFADLDGPVAALSARPWVARAVARRIVPDTVAVQVAARPPVALARRGEELWTVDRAGAWLGPYSGRSLSPGDDFVLIGVGEGEGDVEEPGALARGAAFLDRLHAEDTVLLRRVSEVEVRRDALAVVDRVARVRLLFGPDAAEPGRASSVWRAFLAVQPEAARHGLLGAEADLRFSGRIVLKAPAGDGHGKT